MSSDHCQSIDPLVTPYVDGELDPSERARVDRHVQGCRPCAARVAAERAVHMVVCAHRSALRAERAPAALRARCGSLCARPSTSTARPRRRGAGRLAAFVAASRWRENFHVLAAAAVLVLVVGGAFLYEATEHSSRVLVGELAADHVKCFFMNGLLGTHQAPEAVEGAMLAGFGWRMQLPQRADRMGLQLVGSRPCLYGEGKIAHLMFRHEGRPVSVFMLPKSVRRDELVEVMGHDAAIWSVGGRTFVLVAQEPRAEVEQLASVFQATLR